jgi:hypothetical protein
MKAEIEGYCHRLVEDQEEALQAALYAKELNATNVEELLCRKFTKECKGAKKKAVEKKPEVGDKKAAADGDDSEKPAKKGKKGGKKGGKKKGGAMSADDLSSFRDSLPKEKEL